MTDQKRIRTEEQAVAERARAKILAEMGVTPSESALFTAIYYGFTIPPSYLPARAAQEDYNPNGPTVTEEECRVALTACLAKGWLQVINESALAKIAEVLRLGRILGPIYGGLPEVGCVDFTDAGADLWHRLCEQLQTYKEPPSAYTDVVHIKTTQYRKTREAALEAIPPDDQDFVVIVTGPVPIGPWRAQWWRRFPEGYRVDIEERMKWQGRGGGGGEGYFMPRFPEKSDPQKLRRVLDCHNVSLAECLLLAAMEHDWGYKSTSYLPRWVAESSESYFGVTVTEEECRTGLEACLRYGWLRVVDQQAIDEVQALLRADPVFLPVPSKVECRQGVIDFTPSGATLYRMIEAEWLGPGWEDALSVEKNYYREEHHYCEAEEGLQGIAKGYESEGELVRASRMVPIGPWCVYWWERFPAGYRLELELGDP